MTIGAIVLSALLLAGCAGTGGDNGGDTPAPGGIDAAACPPRASEPITGDTIRLATSGPLSGPAAAYGDILHAVDAYFEWVNEQGGVKTVDGQKKLSLEILDDQYVPSNTQTNIRQAVEQDDVDAVVAVLGTPAVLSVTKYLNDGCVPALWLAAPSKRVLDVADSLPFTTILSTNYDAAAVVGSFIAQETPDATLATLVQNDDSGEEGLAGLQSGLEGSKVETVAGETFESTDTTVQAQMTTLSASGADAFYLLGTANFCTQALSALGAGSWKPTVYLAEACSEDSVGKATGDLPENIFRTAYQQRPDADTPGMKQFQEVVTAAGLNPTQGTELGYAYAQLAVASIEAAPELTQIGIAEGAMRISGQPPTPSVFLDGVTLSPADGQAALGAYAVTQFDHSKGAFELEDGTLVQLKR